MAPVEVHLKAYELLDAVLAVGTVEEAVEAIREDLEVLPREELVRLTMAVVVELGFRLHPGPERTRMRRRVLNARVRAMWAGS